MKKLSLVLAAASAPLALTAAAAPAVAQSADPTFTGPRIEAIVGYDKTRAGSSVDNDSNIPNDESIDGLLYGVGVGYDIDIGGAVLGAEAEYTQSTAKTEFRNGDFEGFGLGNVKTNRDFYVGARIGAKATPNTLVYVKGGYTNAKFDVRSSDGTTELQQDIDTDGWRAGAGVEHALGQNAFAKLEYRYSNYGKAEIDFGGAIPDSSRFDVDTDRHQVVASLGWRF